MGTIIFPAGREWNEMLREAREIMRLRGRDDYDENGLPKILWGRGLEPTPIPYETPTEQLQEYADILTCAFPDACMLQLVESDMECYLSSYRIFELNITAWGNIAYCSLHGKHDGWRQFAGKMLVQMRRIAKEADK